VSVRLSCMTVTPGRLTVVEADTVKFTVTWLGLSMD
jgi:hypothetical protein